MNIKPIKTEKKIKQKFLNIFGSNCKPKRELQRIMTNQKLLKLNYAQKQIQHLKNKTLINNMKNTN